MVFAVLLIIPLIPALIGFVFLRGFTWKEALVHLAAQFLVAGGSAAALSCVATHDTEILSGSVTGKAQVRVSCSHSYQCRCREECSGSGKNRSCSTVCDTCYEHSHDWNWDVYSSVGSFTIARVDRQGLGQPQRWTVAQTGEPVVADHGYDNYVKASPDSLFRHSGLKEKYAAKIPEYPNRIFDYYRVRRFVGVGISLQDEPAWDADLMAINAELGAQKQVNMIVVLVRDLPPDYFYAVEEAWIGGKKNDVILMVGVDGELKPRWAEVMAWTVDKVLEVKLRDDIMALDRADRSSTLPILRTDVQKYFKRKPMKDFEYLKSSVAPTTGEWVAAVLIGLMVSIGLMVLFHREDVFGEERKRRYA